MKKFILWSLAVVSFLFLFQHCENEADPHLAELTTTAVTDISATSAASGGEAILDGGAPIIARGVCWSTSAHPTINDDKTDDGIGTGIFTSAITGLTGSTTYFVRAYATNHAGVSYGNEIEFTTLPTPTLPEISTASVSSITQNTASSGGVITGSGGAIITARGICWSTSTSPTINDNKTTDGSGIGDFISTLTGLTAGTTYYVRAYATNSVGTVYGNEINFKTSSITTTLFAIKDASIFNTLAGTSPNGNYGGGGDQLLQVGYANPTLMYARSLIQFDLSSIPSNATIESVSLEFKLSSSGTFVPTVYLHKMEQAWTEGTTASSCIAGSACNTQGASITTSNDATWNETSYSGSNSNPWTSLGGTFSSTASASSIDIGASTILYLSDGLKNDVQGWIATSASNFGWIMKTDFITNQSAMRRFYSREGAAASGNSATAPKLVVVYH